MILVNTIFLKRKVIIQTSKRKIHLKFTFCLIFLSYTRPVNTLTILTQAGNKSAKLLFYLFKKTLLGGKELRRCTCFCIRVVETQRLEVREKLQKRLPRPRKCGQGKDSIM